MRALIVFSLLVSGSFAASAQQYLRPKAQEYLRHSAEIIQEVGKEIPRLDSTQKSGKYAMAVAHQRMARNYYEVKDYRNALFHSHFARELALQVFMIRNRMLPPRFSYTTDEKELIAGRPHDEILHKNLIKANPGIRFDDNDYGIYQKLQKLDVDDLK